MAQSGWTLNQCIEHALQNNLTVKKGQLVVAGNHLSYEQSKENFLPSVSGFANNNYSFGRNINPVNNTYIQQQVQSSQFSLNAQMNLFNGMQNANNVKLTRVNEEVSKKDLEVISNNISLQIATQFLQILFNEETINTVKAALASTEQQLVSAKILFEAGNTNQSSVYELEAKLASDKLDLVNAQNNYNLSLLALANLLQVPFDNNFRIESPKVTVPEEVITEGTQAIFDKASKIMPEIELAQLRYRSSVISKSISRGRYYPSLSLNANLSSLFSDNFKDFINPQTSFAPAGYVDNASKDIVYLPTLTYDGKQTRSFSNQINDNLGKSIGVSLSIPLYSNGRIRTAVKQADIATEQQKLNIKQTENELYTSVATALANYTAARAKYSALVESVSTQLKNYEFNRLRFESGAINSTELVISQRNYEMAEARLLQGKYDLVFRKVLLDFYRGKPLNWN